MQGGQAQGAQGATCMSYETCCDGICCNQYQTCVELGETQDGYVNRDGEPLGFVPKVCSYYTLPAQSVLSGVGLLPIVNVITALVASVLVFRRVGVPSEKTIAIPAYLAIALCIAMLIWPRWQSLMMIILSLFGVLVATVSSSPNRHIFALIAALVALQFYAGTQLSVFGLLFWNPGAGYMGVGSASAGSTNPFTNIGTMQAACARFYNYYWDNTNTYDWDQRGDPDLYFGLCSMGMMSLWGLLREILFFVLLTLVAATGFSLMDKSSKGK
jgi:hypothetical protein